MKPKALLVAYACGPAGTGESWLGWGWARAASRRCQVHLVTLPYFRTDLERLARGHDVELHFVSLPRWLWRGTALLGKPGGVMRQWVWQYRAARMGRRLHREHQFAVVHQTTYHSFRIPFLLADLGIPSLWGPIAGGESVPRGYHRILGLAGCTEFLRTVVNAPWLRLPAVRRSLERTSTLFVSNEVTLAFLPDWCRGKATVVMPNALEADRRPAESIDSQVRDRTSPAGTFRLLFVGNCAPTRAMAIVFDALRVAALTNWELTIVGTGRALPSWRRAARRLQLDDAVTFVGHIPVRELRLHYAAADVFVFPALRDSGGSGLLEAMSHGLPVVCLDWAGPAEIVDAASGITISVDRPARTVLEMAAALRQLQDDDSLRRSLGRGARLRAHTAFGWDTKQRLLEATYERLLISRPPGNQPDRTKPVTGELSSASIRS